MVTWLPRSLTLIAVGAIVAFGIDFTTADVDIHRVGLILLAVGVFDLLLNLVLLSYERAMSTTAPTSTGLRPVPDRPAPPSEPPRPHVVDYRRDDYEVEPYPDARPTSHDGWTRTDLPPVRGANGSGTRGGRVSDDGGEHVWRPRPQDPANAATQPIRRKPPA